jgi:hypothetical protein
MKPFNNQALISFEPPATAHFQDWAETSPRTETSGSLEGEGKDERVGVCNSKNMEEYPA